MSWESDAFEAIQRNDIRTVAYLPDSVLSPLIGMVEDAPDVTGVRVAREEEAIAVLTGAWLGGDRGALLCQSSGLANCFNVLGSHVKPTGFPFVGLVTRRGGLSDHNLAQVPAGYGMPRLLDDIGIRNYGVEGSNDVGECIDMAAETTFSTEDPFVLLLEPTLTGGKE